MIPPSELVLNKDGSIYHLKLKAEHIGHKIILAGDPGRIALISSKFDQIDHIIENREFVTHTGYFNGKKISAIATGIGTDNIDIVLNELDALVNVDLKTREVKDKLTSLELVRIGTCGSIQENVPSDEVVVSQYAIGLDGLMNFYKLIPHDFEQKLLHAFMEQTSWTVDSNRPYVVGGDKELIEKIGNGFHPGITITANGFYAPQGRQIRLAPKNANQNDLFRAFQFEQNRIVNYEMETSALYGLSRLMGHKACTVCAVVANRYINSFSKNYPEVISALIDKVLIRLTKDSE